ncbi:hypothetical protein A3J41_03580 [candidate division TM6 bacterium RIFCSPHIGHO2_12_FULL_38_8]|nr:MAG: hypothetical protein A3J41_03580 [candidate division TM6 bacterium RIFCSPHIGHO2_12_FULL_38_8]
MNKTGNFMKKYLIILGLSVCFIQILPSATLNYVGYLYSQVEVPKEASDNIKNLQIICQSLYSTISTTNPAQFKAAVTMYHEALKSALQSYPANAISPTTTFTQFINDPNFTLTQQQNLLSASNAAQQKLKPYASVTYPLLEISPSALTSFQSSVQFYQNAYQQLQQLPPNTLAPNALENAANAYYNFLLNPLNNYPANALVQATTFTQFITDPILSLTLQQNLQSASNAAQQEFTNQINTIDGIIALYGSDFSSNTAYDALYNAIQAANKKFPMLTSIFNSALPIGSSVG